MNGPFQVAQANVAGASNSGTPPRIYRLSKPQGDQAVVLNVGYDQKVKVDFSAIANEKITLVHIGEKLIILFDNKSTVTIEPFFDSTKLSIEVAPGREVSPGEFASLFPVTTDQSVLPAAGGQGNAQGSGANFSPSSVDPLNSGNPLDLLGQEELGNFRVTLDLGVVTPFEAASAGFTLSGALLIHDETPDVQFALGANDRPISDLPSVFSPVGLIGWAQSAGSVITADTSVFGSNGVGSVAYALTTASGTAFNGVASGLIATVTGNPIFLFTEGNLIVGREVDGNGAIAFALYLDPVTFQLSVAQYEAIKHSIASNPDSSDPADLLGVVFVQQTVIDGQGNVAATLVSSNALGVSFLDDGPTITRGPGEGEGQGYIENLVLDETIGDGEVPDPEGPSSFVPVAGPDRYNVGESESGGDLPNPDDTGVTTITVATNPTTAQAIGHASTSDSSGALLALFPPAVINFGTDGPGTVVNVFTLVLSSATVATNLTATALVGSPLETLDVAARQIVLVQVNDTTIEGRVVGDGIPGNGDEFVAFRITLVDANTPTAHITIDQFFAIDHGGSENPSQFDEQTFLNLIGNGTLDLKLVTTVTDADGDFANSPVQITIVGNEQSFISFDDDGPVLVSATGIVASVDEDGLPGHNDDAGRTGETTGAVVSATATGAAGSLNAFVDFGTDGAGATAFHLAAPAAPVDSGLTSKGSIVLIASDGTTLHGYVESGNGSGFGAGDREVFTLTVGGDGSYSFTLKDQIDHSPLNGVENGDDTENLLASTLDLSSFIVATDGDGDSVTLGTGSFSVEVRDDIPVLTSATISRTVDEDDIVTPWSQGTHPNDGAGDGSLTENSTGAAIVSGTLLGLVSVGADEPGVFGFSADAVAKLAALGLFSKESAQGDGENGKLLTYAISNGGSNEIVITGSEPNPQGNPVFSLTLNTVTGAYTFRLFDELIHTVGDGENTNLRSGLPDGNGQASVPYLDFGSIITFTDRDGDSVTLSGKFTVTITDDVPEADIDLKGSSVTVDESAGNQADDTTSSSVRALFAKLENSGIVGNDPDVPGDSNGGVAGAGAIAYARSDFAVVVDDSVIGSDSPPYPHQFTLSVAGGDGIASGLFVTDGSPIILSKNADGLIIGTVSGGAFNGQVAFAIAIESNGEVSVAQYLSIKHDDRGDSNETNDNDNNSNDASPDDPLTIQQTLDGKIIATLTVTDSDGDQSSNSVNIGNLITFLDDGPSVDLKVVHDAHLIHDETPGIDAPDDDVAGTTAFAGSTLAAVFAAVDTPTGDDPHVTDNPIGYALATSAVFSFATQSYGADGTATTNPVKYELLLSSSNVHSGLTTTDGRDIHLFKEGNLIVGRYEPGGNNSPDGSSDEVAAFAISIDPATGQLAMVQYISLRHPDDNNPDDTVHLGDNTLSVRVTITDGDGDPASDTVDISEVIQFEDDGPTITTASLAVSVDEDGLATGNADAGRTGETLGTGSAVASGGAGALNALVNFGADGPDSAAFSLAVQSSPVNSGLDSKGGDVFIVSDGTTLRGYVNLGGNSGYQAGTDREVFTFTVGSNGSYTFTLKDQIDHPTLNNVAGDNTENVLPSALDLSKYIVATDGDGDTVKLDTGDFVVQIRDDIPIQLSGSVSGTVEEDDLTNANSGNHSVGNNEDLSVGKTVVSGSLTSLVKIGADENGTFVLDSNGIGALQSQNLKSHGIGLVYSISGDTLTATAGAGGVTVFTLQIQSNGNYTFTLKDQIDHAAGNGENTLNIDLSPVARFVDFDSDGVTLSGGFNIIVQDDIPVQNFSATVSGSVQEDALTDVNSNHQSIGNFEGGQTTVATGVLTSLVSVGADEPGTFSLASVPTGLPAITSKGAAVTYSVTGDTLTGYVDANSSGTVDAGDRTIFTLKVTAAGAYTFTLLDQIDHLPNSPANNDSQTLTLNLSSAVQFTDADSDTITLSGGFAIIVEDDVPTTASNTLVTVDEDDLTAGNHDTTSPGDDVTSVSPVTGTLQFSVGADELATVGFASLDATAVLNASGVAVTAGGVALLYLWDSSTNTLYATPDGTAGHAAFKIVVTDQATGAYSFSLLGQIDHPANDADGLNNGPDTAYEDNININLTYTVTDRDGDFKTGTLSVSIDDDMPILVQAPVNLISNGDFSLGTFAPESFGGIAQPNGVTGWTVAGSSFEPPATLQVERVNDGYLGLHSSTLGSMIDMGASPGNIQISQQLSGLTAGQTYAIQFEAGAPYPSTAKLEVVWNNVVIGTIDPAGPMTSYSYVVTASGVAINDQITFREVGQGNLPIPGQATEGHHGTYLANVAVIATAIVDEDGLPTGNHDSQIGDATDTNADTDNNEATATGNLNIKWGADNLDTVAADITTGPFGTFDQDAVGGAANRSVTFTDSTVTVAGGTPLYSQGVLVTFQLNGDGTVLTGVAGGRTVFEVSLSDDGTGKFRFVLLDQLDHAPNGNENDIALTFNYTATDSDGDAVSGKFVVSVDDDVPVLTSATIAVTVDEDDIVTPWSQGTHPNDGSGDGSLTEGSTGAAIVSGTLSGLVSVGADEPGKFGFSSDAVAKLAALGLFSKESAQGDGDNGKPLTYSTSTGGANEIVITGSEPNPQGNPVFSLTLNTVTGGYVFRLFDELIHTVGGEENTDLRSGLPVGNVQASVPYIDFGSLITFTDKDGDSVTLSGKFTVTITDDVPEADIDLKGSSVTADETPGDQADDTSSSSVKALFANLENSGIVGNDPDVAGDSNGGVAGAGAIAYARSDFAVVVDDSVIGSDSPPYPHQFSLSVSGSAVSGLFVTDGSSILLSKNADGLIIGTVSGGAFNGQVAFAIAIDSDGRVSVAQYLSIKHDDPSDHNESNDANDGNNSTVLQTLNGKIVATLTVTDSDGDQDSDSVNIGNLIGFLDDGPTVFSNDDVVLEDDDLANGIDGGPNDDSAPQNASGTLEHTYGADGPGSTLLTGFSLPSGFTATVSGDGLSLLIKQNGVDVLKVELTDATSGNYKVTQLHAIDHPTLNGQNGDDTENNLNFTVNYRVTDGDGDTANGTLKINVDDDSPEPNFVLQSGKLVVIDETAGLQNATATPGVVGDSNDTDAAGPFPVSVSNAGTPGSDSTLFNAPAIAKSAGAVVAVTPNYGADGPGSVVYSIDVPGTTELSGLTTTSGKAITLFEVSPTLVVGRYDANNNGVSSSDPAAFAIHIDAATGVMTVIQYVPIKHDDRGDFDEDNDNGNNANDAAPDDALTAQQSIINSALRVTVAVTDHDGDTVDRTYEIGNAVVFEDDGPSASIVIKANAALTVDETDGVAANAGETDPVGGNLGVAKISGANLFTETVSYGADGQASSNAKVYSLSLLSSGPTGLKDTATGSDIVLVNNGGLIEGHAGSAGGALVFTIAINTSTGETTLTQWRAIVHGNPADPDESSTPAVLNSNLVGVTVAVTDGDGDTTTATANLNNVIKFEDDGPTLVSTSATVTGSVEEDGMTLAPTSGEGANPDTQDGNKQAGDDFTQDQASGASGSLSPLVNFGADGPAVGGGFSITTTQAVLDGLPTLYSGGQPVVYSSNGTTLTATNSVGQIVFTLTVNANGSWNFDLDGQLDHVDDPANDENSLLRTSASDTVGVAGIDFSKIIVATDGDGDSITGLAPGKFTISVQDDIPTIVPPVGAGLGPDLIVNGSFETFTPNLSGDNFGLYSSIPGWSAGNGTPFELQAGNAGGLAAFQGNIKVELDGDTADNPGGGNGVPTANTHATIQQTVATTSGQAYQLSFYYSPRANDGDGDSSGMQVLWNGSVVHTLDGATPGWQQITLTVTGTGGNDVLGFRGFGAGEENELGAFIDLVSLQATNAFVVDEDGLPTGNHDFAPGDDQGQLADDGPLGLPANEATAQGALGIIWGADAVDSGPADTNGGTLGGFVQDTPNGLGDRSVTFIGAAAPAGLSSHGAAVSYWVSADGTFLVAYTGAAPTPGNEPAAGSRVFEVSLSDDGSGAFRFVLLGQLDHAPGQVENNLFLTFGYTATDSDSDSVTGSFTINIDDDMPTAVSATNAAVDEDDLTGAGHPGNSDLATGDDLADPSPVSVTGSFGISFGADGAAAANAISGVSFTPAVTSDGLPVSMVFDSGVWYGRAGGVGGDNVFSLEFNTGTGQYTFTLLDNLDHPVAGTEDNIVLNFSFDATDFDGDTASGSFSINADDDMPVATSATNLLSNGDFTAPDDFVANDQDNWGNPWGGFDPDGISGWTVSASPVGGPAPGQIEIQRKGDTYLGMNAGGSPMIDMAASPGNIQIAQSVNLTNGEVYVIQFQAGTPVTGTAQLEVYWNGALVASINPPVDSMGTFTYAVTAVGGANTLTFREVGLNNTDPVPEGGTHGHHGTYLANVSLVPAAEVDEDGLTLADSNGNADGVGDSNQIGDAPTNSASVTKSLGIQWGADDNDSATDVSGIQDAPIGVANRGLTFTNATVTIGGVSSLTSNGDAVSYEVVDNGTRLVGYVNSGAAGYSNGERLVFEVTLSDDGSGSFKFTLRDNLDHAPGVNENDISLSFNYTAKDSDGDTATGSFVVSVDDDMPVTGSDAPVVVDEDDLAAGNHDTTSPGDNAASGITGTLNFAIGADSPASGFTTLHGAVVVDTSGKVVTSGGVALHYYWDGPSNTLFGSTDASAANADATAAFKLHVTDPSTGAYTFSLLGQVDHPGHDADLANNGPDTAYEDNINIDLTYAVTDRDGDSASGTLSISIDDDMPILVQAPVSQILNGDFSYGIFSSASFGGIAQPNGVTGWTVTNSTFEPPAPGGLQVERVNDGYLGLHSSTQGSMIDMGASPGNIQISQQLSGLIADQTYAIQFEAGAPYPSTAELEVVWNNVVIGTIDPVGPMTSYAYVVTATGIAANDQITFREVGQGNLPIPGQATEGYHGTYLANVAVIATSVVDEDGLTGPLSFGNHDSKIGDAVDTNADLDFNEATATGNLNIKWGADNSDSAADTAEGLFGTLVQDAPGGNGNRSLTFDDANVTVAGGVPLTSHGLAVTFALGESDTVLTGATEDGRTVLQVSLSDDDSGKFRFVLLDQLDHAPNGDENDIALTFNYTATDSDGDAVSSKFVVSVDDDEPVIDGFNEPMTAAAAAGFIFEFDTGGGDLDLSALQTVEGAAPAQQPQGGEVHTPVMDTTPAAIAIMHEQAQLAMQLAAS